MESVLAVCRSNSDTPCILAKMADAPGNNWNKCVGRLVERYCDYDNAVNKIRNNYPSVNAF
jgi:hypothetical protein